MFDQKIRVLIVDDFPSMREMIGRSMKELGYNDLTEAEDGLLAWNAVASAQPPIGLIICDLNMPKCNGIEFLKKVRKQPATSVLFF
jgi:two-component system chemotaxis response regulator CheY